MRSMFGNVFGGASRPGKAREVKEWVRKALGHAPDADVSVLVSELRCSELGCPPLETCIAVLGLDGTRLERKLHTSLAELTEADVVGCFQETLEGKTP